MNVQQPIQQPYYGGYYPPLNSPLNPMHQPMYPTNRLSYPAAYPSQSELLRQDSSQSVMSEPPPNAAMPSVKQKESFHPKPESEVDSFRNDNQYAGKRRSYDEMIEDDLVPDFDVTAMFDDETPDLADNMTSNFLQ